MTCWYGRQTGNENTSVLLLACVLAGLLVCLLARSLARLLSSMSFHTRKGTLTDHVAPCCMPGHTDRILVGNAFLTCALVESQLRQALIPCLRA